MSSFPAASTYEAQFTINDNDGSPLELANAAITYVFTRRLGGDQVLLELTDGDDAVEVEPDGETGVVDVTVPAADVPEGTVFEELRVDLTDRSTVVSQRSVTFDPVTTEP